jgi:fructokinase
MSGPTRRLRIGVDLGGTKTEVIALAPDGRELVRRRAPTPSGDYQAQLALVREMVAGIEAALGGAGTVGVAIPGTISAATGLIKNANSIWLNGQPLDRDLAEALGRPVRVLNDANCLAMSEASDGAGVGHGVVFAAILGTGVGGGIVVHGRPLSGINGVAGEWGHNPLPWPRDEERPGPACYCGLSGCIETFCSGPGLAADHRAATGRDWRGEAIAAAAATGDPGAAAALARYVDRLARGLASVINLLDPDIVVLGGGMSNIDRLYDELPRHWPRWVFSDRVDTRLAKAVHGDSSGVRGAAWLWPAEPT